MNNRHTEDSGARGAAHDHDHGDAAGHDAHDDHAHDDHGRSGHAHSHGHAHAIGSDGVTTRMGIAIGLNLCFVVIEASFGFLSNSVALIADAGHNLGDVLGLACACAAVFLSRRPPGRRVT
jgi:cobalt-zinc-cadmium efflux system protein